MRLQVGCEQKAGRYSVDAVFLLCPVALLDDLFCLFARQSLIPEDDIEAGECFQRSAESLNLLRHFSTGAVHVQGEAQDNAVNLVLVEKQLNLS